MISELNIQDFYKIWHITDQCRNVEVRAIINGNNPGRVYVDDSTEPTAALIWIQGQKGFQIVGNVQSQSFLADLEGYMRQHIEPKLKKLNIHSVEIGAEMNIGVEAIPRIFQSHSISSDHQHVFRLTGSSKPIVAVDHGITVRRIDRDLWGSRRLTNHSFLEKKILHFWDSMDSFLHHGFGYLAEYNNTMVSICFSGFVADQTHAIDIETLEGHRRRNYGAAVAGAFVWECMQNGVHPYWDCSPENTGSIQLAKSIGMSPYFDYQIFWYNLS